MRALAAAAAAFCAAALLAACAPDAFKPANDFDAFLNQVEKACYYKPIGPVNVGQMLSNPGSMQSTYFMDETSRLFYGKISRDNWTSAVTAFIQGRASDPGVQCVLEQYDRVPRAQAPPIPIR